MSIVNVEALKSNGCQLWWPGAVASANSPKQITSYGDCKQILPFPGAGIGMFDGTGDYLTTNIGANLTGDFTIECWARSTTTSDEILFGCRNASEEQLMIDRVSSSRLYTRCGTTVIDITSGVSFIANTYNHYVLQRSGSAVSVYLDGVLVGSGINSDVIQSQTYNIFIGTRSVLSNYWNGMISEFHISNIARYTTNFTPPRRQLESDSNTKLLLHFNRNDTTFIDSSPSAHTITAYGDAKQLCSPCGSGVAYFDGNGDYIDTPDSTGFTLGAFAFTVEAFVKRLSTGARHFICGQCNSSGSTSSTSISLEINDANKVSFLMCSGETSIIFESTTTITDNNWHHIAISRYATTLYMAIDGSVTTMTISNVTVNDSSNKFAIGRPGEYPGLYFNGYISEFRFCPGATLYTANFTPQTTPFFPDPSTKLLLHFDGVGNAFYDSSDPPGDNGFPILPDGVTITPNGTFAVEKMKDGRNIWKFNGTDTYISLSDHDSWAMFLNDFTICGWIKFDNITSVKFICGQYASNSNYWNLSWWNSDNTLGIVGITSGVTRFYHFCTFTPVANTWYFITVVRSGTSCLMYIDGSSKTVTTSTAFSTTGTDISATLNFGKYNTTYMPGNLKDMQIFKGRALTQDQIAAIMKETYIY